MAVIGQGSSDRTLATEDVRRIVADAVERMAPDGQRVLAVIPDHTRTCPLPEISRLLQAALAGRAKSLDFLIALGTHPALNEEQIDRLLGVPPGRRGEVLPGCRVFNHDWKDPAALRRIGTIPAEQVRRITQGRFEMDVPVTINRRIFDYDALLVAGPVFPHEVAGFSGGAKYFFPGICGEELLNFFHWLGAVITCPKIIGTKDTPVRALLHEAAALIDIPAWALCMVVRGHDLAGLYFGDVVEAWSAAADLSDRVHIAYADRPFDSVLARAPEMYDELWVAAKCMYKMEPVVADGGELIIFAPHLKAISAAHGRIIEEIGYHCLPYFLAQWDRFKHHPWGVLAHSTHVRGIGTYDNGVERPRIRVTLASGIPEAICRKVNLGYRDPDTIDVAHWQGKEAEGRLYVPQAGETLYKLRHPPDWQRFDTGR